MATALRHDSIEQLGEFLRAARERAGLTLQQVSNTTKIPRRHLDAIEHGDISVVPKGPYRRGEVRAFAQAVGLDQNVALAQLEEALPAVTRDKPGAVPVEPVDAERSWGAALMLLVAVVGLVALLMWNRDTASSADVAPAATPAPEYPGPPSIEATPGTLPTSHPAVAVAAPEADSPPVQTVRPTLLVTSDPPGARVVVDGIGRGMTPATIDNLSLGQKTVRVVLDGHASEERSVILTAKRPAVTLHVELQPN